MQESKARQVEGFSGASTAATLIGIRASGVREKTSGRKRKMRRSQQRLLWLGISILGVLNLSAVLLGQASRESEAALPAISDWTQHHVIFSRPANAEQARRVQQDPRYRQQLRRQSAARLPQPATVGVAELRLGSTASRHGKNKLKRDWSEDIGSGATVGAGNYPAKFSFNTSTASCASDFTVYNTGVLGSGSQASIVAYNNLYSGCTGTVPAVYWAYNTAGTISTSVVFSLDGSQLAFMQKNTSGGTLVLLRWAASGGTVGSPTTVTGLANNLYVGCIAPCRTEFALSDSGTPAGDTNSSVFYDYSSDTAYVGDDRGFLHKFHPVFDGVPKQITTGGWPVQVNPGSTATTAPLTDPVYDSTTGNVFVEDKGGFLYWLNSATLNPPVTKSGQLDNSTTDDSGPGFVEGPIVDSTAGLVYAFATSDGSLACPVLETGTDCSAVWITNTTFSSGDVPARAIVGTSTARGTTPSPLYIGGFDSTYQNSVNGTGNLYVCGNTGGDPIVYQVAVSAGNVGTVSPGPPLSSNLTGTPCSPVTDVFNPNATGGATEWIFASAETDGSSPACSVGSGGCVFNFKDTPWQPSTAYAVGQEILDSHFQIQVVTVAGTSGTSAPTWSTTAGDLTPVDGTVVWLDQGVQSASTPAWAPNTAYFTNKTIVDGNGNIELVTIAGTSGTSSPAFSSTPGVLTLDAPPLTWMNVGPIATAALPEAGGTSGIIIDNIVGSGTLAGASEIYFSTLGGGCGTGTDGCAVQASQSGLQ
jgi:hypothetical protein